jgi:hypothetical protein
VVRSPYTNWNSQPRCRCTYKVICLLGKLHKTYSVFVKENYQLIHPVALTNFNIYFGASSVSKLFLHPEIRMWITPVLRFRNYYQDLFGAQTRIWSCDVKTLTTQCMNKWRASWSSYLSACPRVTFTFTKYTQQCNIRKSVHQLGNYKSLILNCSSAFCCGSNNVGFYKPSKHKTTGHTDYIVGNMCTDSLLNPIKPVMTD